MKFRCRCFAHFLKCVKGPPEKRMERAVSRWISGNASQRWGDDIHVPLCPPRQLHLTFFCAPQWDTFFLVMGCPHVWHFLNSSIKQVSFTIVFDWLKSFSVFSSDFGVAIDLNSVSWWKRSFRQSTDATLHKLSLCSAGGGNGDEVLGAPEAIWENRDRCVHESVLRAHSGTGPGWVQCCISFPTHPCFSLYAACYSHLHGSYVICYTYRNWQGGRWWSSILNTQRRGLWRCTRTLE